MESYLQTSVFPLLDELVAAVICERPENVVEFLINLLNQRKQGLGMQSTEQFEDVDLWREQEPMGGSKLRSGENALHVEGTQDAWWSDGAGHLVQVGKTNSETGRPEDILNSEAVDAPTVDLAFPSAESDVAAEPQLEEDLEELPSEDEQMEGHSPALQEPLEAGPLHADEELNEEGFTQVPKQSSRFGDDAATDHHATEEYLSGPLESETSMQEGDLPADPLLPIDNVVDQENVELWGGVDDIVPMDSLTSSDNHASSMEDNRPISMDVHPKDIQPTSMEDISAPLEHVESVGAVAGSDYILEDVTSPRDSMGLMSPSHSPSNIAKYLSRGPRKSLTGEPTDDLLSRFTLEGGILEELAAPADINQKRMHSIPAPRSKIMEIFGMSAMFSALSETDVNALIDSMEFEEYLQAGSPISLSNSFLFIGEGRVAVGDKLFAHGNILGEFPGMHYIEIDFTDAESIRTADDYVAVYRLERDMYEFIVRNGAIRKRENILNRLRQIRFMKHLSADKLQKLSEAVKVEHYPAYEDIAVEGATNSKLFIVDKGTCVEWTSTGLSKQLHPGDCFGQESFLNTSDNQDQNIPDSDVSLGEDTVLLVIERSDVERMMGPVEELFEL